MARILKRLSGPVLVLIALGLVKLQQRPITEAIGVEFATGPASYAFASAGYFALAWFGGRLFSVALESTSKRQRRVPKLLQEIIAAAFFLVALVATGALFLGRSGAGALASSGLVIAILGFAIRNVLADVLSGIALGLEVPFRIGDWVEFDSSLRA
ncbi:MAG: mechanosensitive ion channel family protein [Rhizobiaceae bacterium]|nr:mechanosensitive ion channel family protein [Rhizobiaceae bacterium]